MKNQRTFSLLGYGRALADAASVIGKLSASVRKNILPVVRVSDSPEKLQIIYANIRV